MSETENAANHPEDDSQHQASEQVEAPAEAAANGNHNKRKYEEETDEEQVNNKRTMIGEEVGTGVGCIWGKGLCVGIL